MEADIKAIEVSQFKTREDLDAKKEALKLYQSEGTVTGRRTLPTLRNENRRNVGSVAKTSRKNVEEAGGRYRTYGGYALQTVETWVHGPADELVLWNT